MILVYVCVCGQTFPWKYILLNYDKNFDIQLVIDL